MDMKSVSEKELTRYLMPILKRNFLEWKSLKRGLFSKSGVKDASRDEDKIEKIILSEPVAAFYAHWLKLPRNKENDERLYEKITSYIRGIFTEDLKDEFAIKMFFAKCNLIANIFHRTTLKIIDSALALQNLMNKDRTSLNDIFENEKAFKIITKNSMSALEWGLSAALSLGWVAKYEIDPKDLDKVIRASHTVLSKREKELFS